MQTQTGIVGVNLGVIIAVLWEFMFFDESHHHLLVRTLLGFYRKLHKIKQVCQLIYILFSLKIK